MEYILDNVKVEWVTLGEGKNGDYNPDDPDDIELLRFDVSEWVDGEWEYLESRCTNFPTKTTEDEQRLALDIIARRMKKRIDANSGVRLEADDLSWIDPSWK